MMSAPRLERNAPGAGGEALHVVLLLRRLGFGGAERQAVLLGRELAARGRRVTIATFYDGGELAPECERAGIALHPIGKGGRGDALAFARRFARFVAASRADVLYSFLPAQNLVSLLARAAPRRPALLWGVRASAMEMGHYDWLSRLAHGAEPGLSRLADRVIANSEAGAANAKARGFDARRISVVRNAVDLDRFSRDAGVREAVRAAMGFAPDDLVVCHVARFDPMKDHAGFLAAFAMAQAERPQLRALCLTCGPPDAGRRLKGLIAGAGLSAHMRVADAELDAADAMRAGDLFCSSSAFGEGFSNVLCEALASGLPCAATDVGDAAAIVADAGALAPPREARALARAIVRVAERLAEERRSIAARARAQASRFSPAAMAAASEAVMREALAARA